MDGSGRDGRDGQADEADEADEAMQTATKLLIRGRSKLSKHVTPNDPIRISPGRPTVCPSAALSPCPPPNKKGATHAAPSVRPTVSPLSPRCFGARPSGGGAWPRRP